MCFKWCLMPNTYEQEVVMGWTPDCGDFFSGIIHLYHLYSLVHAHPQIIVLSPMRTPKSPILLKMCLCCVLFILCHPF
jgi:hypothetical protein